MQDKLSLNKIALTLATLSTTGLISTASLAEDLSDISARAETSPTPVALGEKSEKKTEKKDPKKDAGDKGGCGAGSCG